MKHDAMFVVFRIGNSPGLNGVRGLVALNLSTIRYVGLCG